MADEKKVRRVAWYEIAYGIALLALLGMVAFYIRQPKVGVLDEKRLMERLGDDQLIRTKVMSWRKQAQERALKLRESFSGQAEMLMSQIEATDDDEERKQLTIEMTELQKTTQRSVEEINREMLEYQEGLITAFRARIKPMIDEVAAKRRLNIVLNKNTAIGIMHANPRVDITDYVIEKAQNGSGETVRDVEQQVAEEIKDMLTPVGDAE